MTVYFMPQPCPECCAGKHRDCDGTTWDTVADAPTVCPCASARHEATVLTGEPEQLDLSPGSPEHSRRITASKVAAILGVSPWDSPRSVWHQMRGEFERETNDSMRRGHYLEPAILAWWRDQHGMRGVSIAHQDEWHEQWTEQPVFTLGDWAAATPDAVALIGTEGEADWERVLVEAKSAAYDDDWGDPGTDEIPAYYLVQVQWQMHVSGVHACYVPVLTSRLRFVEYVVPYYEEYGAELEARMRTFYDSLSADEPPELDDSVATFNAIRKLHKDIDLDRSVELTEPQAAELVEWYAQSKQAEKPLLAAKSAVLEVMGAARYATYNGRRIARRQADGPDRTKFVVVGKPSDLIVPDMEESA